MSSPYEWPISKRLMVAIDNYLKYSDKTILLMPPARVDEDMEEDEYVGQGDGYDVRSLEADDGGNGGHPAYHHLRYASHPSGNPRVNPGTYSAYISGATINRYHKGTYLQIRMVLDTVWLFVTNVYFRDRTAGRDPRFGYLCRATGLTPEQVKADPALLTGQTIEVEIMFYEHRGNGYVDVSHFRKR